MIKKLLILLVLLTLAGFLAFRIYEAWNAGEVSRAAGGMRRPSVVVQATPVESFLFRDTVELIGELRPRARVEILPKVSGRLQRVYVENGDRVREGQLLADFDDREVRQQVESGRANLSVAEAALRQQEANLLNLNGQLRRFEELYTAQLIALQDLEDLRSRVKVAEAQKELAQAQIHQAQASLAEHELVLQQMQLFSPFSGFVGERYLDPGALVSLSTPVVSVIDLSTIKSVAAVPELQLRRLRPGHRSVVRVDAYPETPFEGTISRISPVLDPATRTAEVEVLIPNPQALLKGGMFARLQILVDSFEGLSIPREALVNRDDLNGVFVVDDGKARFVQIRIGLAQEGRLQVLQGVEEGQEVIFAGAQFLNEGDLVRVVDN